MEQSTLPTLRNQKILTTVSDFANKPRNRTYTMIIFSLIAIILLIWFAIRPTIKTILQLRREIADKSVLNNRMDEKIATLIAAQDSYNTLQPKIALLNQALPAEPEALKFLSALQQIDSSVGMKTTGIILTDVALSTSSGKPAFLARGDLESSPAAEVNSSENQGTFTISATLTGTFETFHAYIETLASMRRLNSIVSLELKPNTDIASAESGSERLLQILLHLIAYYKETGT